MLLKFNQNLSTVAYKGVAYTPILSVPIKLVQTSDALVTRYYVGWCVLTSLPFVFSNRVNTYDLL